MEYTEKEKQHELVMSSVAKMCRSNKKGFIDGYTDKLDAIRELLKDSGYYEILLPGVQIWRKNLSAPIDVIVSSHADVVGNITKCSSELSEDGYYSGTYDNSGTTAASVIAMLEGNVSDNVVFAFTSEEETGRCLGAKQVLEYARNTNNEPVCIALDVTYEGYDEGYLYTVENLSSGHKKNEDVDFLNKVADSMISLETDERQNCIFVRLSKHICPTTLDKKHISNDTGWFDEAQAYVNEYAKAFSLCLPCEGNMHSNRGVDVRQPVFEGYVNALECMIYMMSKDVTKEEVIQQKKDELSRLLDKSLEMVAVEEKEKEKYQQTYYSRLPVYTKKYSSYSSIGDESEFADMSEDDYYDYMAYNESYGVNGGYYADSFYDKDVYPDFKSYVDSVIADIVDSAFEYSEEDILYFMEDVLNYMPKDVVAYYGGLEYVPRVLIDIFNNVLGTEYKEDDFSLDDLGIEMDDSEEMDEDDSEYEESLDDHIDRDGYEYEKNIQDYIDEEESQEDEENNYEGYYDEL